MWRLRILLLVVVTVSLFACSLFISTDGLDNDAGAAPSSSTPDDASSRGERDEGLPPINPNDGGSTPTTTTTTTDGGVGADGGLLPSPCATSVPNRLVCEDFDSANPLANWFMAGTVFVDGLKFLSRSSSLVSATPPTTGAPVSSFIHRDFPPKDRLRAQWSMLNEAPTSCAFANTVALFYDGGASNFMIQVQLRGDNGLQFQEYGQPGEGLDSSYVISKSLGGALPLGQWANVMMAIDRTTAGGPTLNVEVNGSTVLASFKLKGGVGLTAVSNVSFRAGLTYVESPSGACRLRTDNLTLDTF